MKHGVTYLTSFRHFNDTLIGILMKWWKDTNFRKKVQQPGEPFNDFLISLCELAKTCKFCSDLCKENIRDQIFEGSNDGDTVEDLLQENDLTLATTVIACRRAEKQQRKTAARSTQQTQVVSQVS